MSQPNQPDNPNKDAIEVLVPKEIFDRISPERHEQIKKEMEKMFSAQPLTEANALAAKVVTLVQNTPKK